MCLKSNEPMGISSLFSHTWKDVSHQNQNELVFRKNFYFLEKFFDFFQLFLECLKSATHSNSPHWSIRNSLRVGSTKTSRENKIILFFVFWNIHRVLISIFKKRMNLIRLFSLVTIFGLLCFSTTSNTFHFSSSILMHKFSLISLRKRRWRGHWRRRRNCFTFRWKCYAC